MFGYLPHDRQAELIETAPRGRLARIDTQMEADERADLYNALSEARQQQLLSALVQAEREDLLRLAEEGTAGAIMTSDYATIDAQMSAAEAIANCARKPLAKETIYRAYVVDGARKLIDSGGNAGSQAATLMVRGLAMGDTRLRDWSRMIGKEVLVAGLLGLSMALAVSVIGIFRGGPEIALIVSLSMVVIVIVGSVIGMSLSFLLSPAPARSGDRIGTAGHAHCGCGGRDHLLHHRD